MRAVFFGTPEFAVPSLDALHHIADVQLVLCQPDKPKGRGLKLAAPPVKVRAEQLGLPVWQPTKLKDGEVAARLRSLSLDVAVVVAYGRILPSDILNAPKHGCVNVHASVLPKYRGASPISWAIVQGEKDTGVTLIKMDEGMDTGGVLATFRAPILPQDHANSLSARLAELGGLALLETLPRYLRSEIQPEVQNESEASYAPLLKKEDGRLEWSLSAHQLYNRIRGMFPWPGAYTFLAGKRVKILKATVFESSSRPEKGEQIIHAGEIEFADKLHLLVQTGKGKLKLDEIQLEGKNPVKAREWFLGRGVKEKDRFDG